MSKKKIIAIIASVVVIFGMCFAVYRTLSASGQDGLHNTYVESSQSSSQSSSQRADSQKDTTKKTHHQQKNKESSTSSRQTTTKSTHRESQASSSSSQASAARHSEKKSQSAKSTVTVKSSVTAQHQQKKAQAQAVCQLTIRGPISDGNRILLRAKNVQIHHGDMVIDILSRVTKDHHMALSFKGSGKTVYVRGIAGLFEFDKGSGSGWLYSVNRVFPGYSCGVKKVHDGDNVEWLYTEDLGKDRNAPQVK